MIFLCCKYCVTDSNGFKTILFIIIGGVVKDSKTGFVFNNCKILKWGFIYAPSINLFQQLSIQVLVFSISSPGIVNENKVFMSEKSVLFSYKLALVININY